MKKIFNKIKIMFVDWLLKEKTTELKRHLKQEFSDRDNRLCELENHMRLVKSVTNIGLNLEHPRYDPRSWIAINIHGEKEDWVQFFDVNENDLKHLKEMFRSMQKSKIAVDSRPRMTKRDFWFY